MGIEQAGTFAIGGELTVNRLGYGAMRLCGPGVAREWILTGVCIHQVKIAWPLELRCFSPDMQNTCISPVGKPFQMAPQLGCAWQRWRNLWACQLIA